MPRGPVSMIADHAERVAGGGSLAGAALPGQLTLAVHDPSLAGKLADARVARVPPSVPPKAPPPTRALTRRVTLLGDEQVRCQVTSD